MSYRITILGDHGKLYEEAAAIESKIAAELDRFVGRLGKIEGAKPIVATLNGSASDHQAVAVEEAPETPAETPADPAPTDPPAQPTPQGGSA